MGFRIKAVKKPKIVESIRKVRDHNLFITRSSEATIKQISSYKRIKNADDEYLEEPQKFGDDAAVVIRYGIITYSRKSIIKII